MSQVVPPQNIQAEESVLGAMLVAEPALATVISEIGLAAEDFYLEKHATIFACIHDLVSAGKAVDELIVSDSLAQRGEVDGVGGKHYISELAAKVPAAGNAKHYAEIVQSAARWRRRLAAGQLIQEAALASDDEKFTTAQGRLADGPGQERVLYDADRQRDLIFELIEGKRKAEFFWPFPKLNRLQDGGMRRGQLIVLSGYTNEGKSHVAGQLLDVNRKHGRVCLYDNEMEPDEQAARRAARVGGVPYGALMDGSLDKAQRSQAMKFLNAEDLHWPIVDTSGWTVEEVCLHIRQYRWDFVVIDILHNFPFDDERQLSASVARLKAAARLAQCCVVLVAHVNRTGVERGRRRRPVRSDLRWSGDIENLADAVCFVYRKQDEDTLEPTPEGYVYFDKCRGGELGGQKVHFNSERLRFEVLSAVDSPAPVQGTLAA